jgi:KaiC/GvpD/RAD55 family RecA-like ATPase
MGFRTQKNAQLVRCYWLDIDCGQDKATSGKGYETKDMALGALKGFCSRIGLPDPLVNDSGGGIHVYWPLDSDIPKDEWQPVADKLKELTHSLGLKADDSRTADAASVLRPVGTINRKPTRNGARVTTLAPGVTSSPVDFESKINSAYKAICGPKPVHNPVKDSAPPISTTENATDDQISQIIAEAKLYEPDLWAGNWQDLGRHPSQSEADMALSREIARAAVKAKVADGALSDAVWRAFSQSGLFRPEKKRAMVKHTIPKAVATALTEHEEARVMLEEAGLLTIPVTEAAGTAVNPVTPPPGVLFGDLILNDDDVASMTSAKFLIPNLIVQGHVAAYAAPANGGKTALFIHVSEQLAKLGMEVLYINVDASPADLRRHHQHAKQHGYVVIAPDAKLGKSPADVLMHLKSAAISGESLSNKVFIFDTLKKFVDVIDKRAAKELYRLFRKLSVQGATICLLSHTNKYPGADGKAIYEGTADLRNDLDELIYLESFKPEGGGFLEITTRPDKVRADFEPRSYILDLKTRQVREANTPIPIYGKTERELRNLIVQAVQEGSSNQKDIVEYVMERSEFKDRKIRLALKDATHGISPYLTVSASGNRNVLTYAMKEATL